MDAALKGIVIPGDVNGSVSAEEHNLGGYSGQSPFTSWTETEEIARSYAKSQGPGGLILRVLVGPPPEKASWSWTLSPDVFCEGEVLLRGIRSGVEVMLP
jgi:hypothetical protein